MTTTPAPEPTPSAPVATTSPGPTANPVSKAVHWLETHVLPSLKAVDGYAEQLIGEALKIEAAVQAIDPVIGSQLSASATVLREVAEGLKAL